MQYHQIDLVAEKIMLKQFPEYLTK